MKAARFAVYNAKNTTANSAQILDINLKQTNKSPEIIRQMYSMRMKILGGNEYKIESEWRYTSLLSDIHG